MDFSDDDDVDLSKTRSVYIRIDNTTKIKFRRKVYTLERGKWVILPPEVIEPNSKIEFSSRSDGLVMGTLGRVFYQVEGNKIVIRSFSIALLTKKKMAGKNNDRICRLIHLKPFDNW